MTPEDKWRVFHIAWTCMILSGIFGFIIGRLFSLEETMKRRDLILCLSLGVSIALGIYAIKWMVKPRVIEAERKTSGVQWTTNNESPSPLPSVSEIARRSALAGLAMGLNRGDEGYQRLSNEIWAVYTDKTNAP